MTTNSYRINEAAVSDTCAFPAFRELLPDYLADQLGDTAAERLEDHLLVCSPCREEYLQLLKLLGSAFAAFTEVTAPSNGDAQTSNHEPVSGGGTVLRLDDFRKRRS